MPAPTRLSRVLTTTWITGSSGCALKKMACWLETHSLQRYPTGVRRAHLMHIGRPHLLQRSDVSTLAWTMQNKTSGATGAVSAMVMSHWVRVENKLISKRAVGIQQLAPLRAVPSAIRCLQPPD